jgi:Zn-dependent protease with chaperone function
LDFFQAQDQARRNTWKLLLLFLVAAASIILAVYLLLFGVLASDAIETGHGFPDLWDPQLFGVTALGVGLLIGSGSLYKTIALSLGGGGAVAKSLGGRLVSRETQDPLEQRLLNVVDEMAIASGLPVPQVFVLDEESGINAFAAGNKPSEAVVAVTRGGLERLPRDELQGVVAHEFSHIFNGDMRINIRLTGLLHGILMLAMVGRTMLDAASSTGHSRSDKKDDGGATIVLLGLGFGLLLIGYIGVFFGQLIQAAVSRQREFLADASAVQYTRNPLGLAGALKRIVAASSRMRHPNSEAASHMFFGEGISHFSRMLATHPPIDERIHRLDPTYTPNTAGLALADEDEVIGRTVGDESETAVTTGFLVAGERTTVTQQDVRKSIGNPEPRHAVYARQVFGDYPEAVFADLNSPTQVASLLYGMLVANTEDPATTLSMALKDLDEILNARVLEHAAWF